MLSSSSSGDAADGPCCWPDGRPSTTRRSHHIRMFDHDVPTPRRLTRRSARRGARCDRRRHRGRQRVRSLGLHTPRLAASTIPAPPSPPPGGCGSPRPRPPRRPCRCRESPTYTAPVPPPSGKVMFPARDSTADVEHLRAQQVRRLPHSRGSRHPRRRRAVNPIFAVADGELVKWYTNTANSRVGVDARSWRRRTRRTSTSTWPTIATG